MSNSAEPKKWKSQMGYIWAVLGSAVGFANILSFSAQCYKNGGGAFLIPSIFAYLILGLPLLMLEAFIGQVWAKPFVAAYGVVFGNRGRFFGWFSILTCIGICSFYVVLTGYCLIYAVFAVLQQIPTDTALFFKEHFLAITPSIEQWGGLSWKIAAATACVLLITRTVLVRDIQSGVEKFCSWAMPLLACLIFIFACLTVWLPGADIGLSHYLTPDFSRLKSFTLWRDVFGQLFFSLSLGLGIITGYSRYNGKEVNIIRAMSCVVLGDMVISMAAGLVIFCSIGYLSRATGVPFNQIIRSDSAFEIGFVIFPALIHIIQGILGQILGILFFICIFIAGITGVFSIVESIVGNFEAEFCLSRRAAVQLALLPIALFALFFCMGNGMYLLAAIEPMLLGISMLIAAIAEIVVYLFYSKSFYSLFCGYFKGVAPGVLRLWSWLLLVLLTTILLGALYSEFKTEGGELDKIIRWGWFAASLAISLFLSRRFKRSAKGNCAMSAEG